jgi:hypothetical protein
MGASPNPATALARGEGARMMNWLSREYYAQGRGKKEKDTTKQSYSWLKDAYNFAHANKDNLDDPDVQHIIAQKMEKLEGSGFFTPRPKGRESVPMEAPGGGAVSMDRPEEYTLADIEQMYQRFKLENPAQFKPYNVETTGDQGQDVTRRVDPMGGGREDFAAQPRTMSEGQSLVQTGDTPSAIFKLDKTKAPGSDTKNQVLSYKKDDPSMTKWVTKGEQPEEGYTLNEPSAPKGGLTKKQQLDILYDVENQIGKMRADAIEPTQADIDKWNRQLEQAGIAERVTAEEVTLHEGWIWDTKGTTGKVAKPGKKSLEDIWGK